MPDYFISNVLTSAPLYNPTNRKDSDMQDCTRIQKRVSLDASDHAGSHSTNFCSTDNISGDSGSANRMLEHTQSPSSIMYDRWQRSNILAIP